MNYSDFELLVVDGNSSDRTQAIAKSFGAKLLVEEKLTRAAACNTGIRSASGEIIVFTDADCTVPEDWLNKIIPHFASADVAAVGGKDLTDLHDSYISKCIGLSEHYRKNPTNQVETVLRIKGCNSAYRAQVLKELGGFDDDLKYFEETELHWRLLQAGYTLGFDSDLWVAHKRRRSLLAFLRLNFANAKEAFKIRDRILGILGKKDIALFLLVVFGTALIVLGSLTSSTAGIASVCLSSSILVAVFSFFRKTRQVFFLPGYLLVFFIYCVGKSLGILAGFLEYLFSESFLRN